MISRRGVSSVLPLWLAILILVASADAATYTVCPYGCTNSSIQDAINHASPGDTIVVYSGTYNENVMVNKPLKLVGINNPTIKALNPAGNAVSVTGSGVVLTGFTITGASTGNGIDVSNTSPLIFYNNIEGNGVGLRNTLASTILSRACFWGAGGVGRDKGKPVSPNNVVIGSVDYAPWLTARTINGKITNASPVVFDNPDAGIRVELRGIVYSGTIMGSAAYMPGEEPYDASKLPAIPIRYFDVILTGNPGGEATITASYADADLAYVAENSLNLYVWDGNNWIAARNTVVNAAENRVSGKFSASLLTGSPVALAGKDYSVTIEPASSPVPYTSKPVLTTFQVESIWDLLTAEYRIDGGNWNIISTGIGAKSWYYPGWSMTDDEWAKLGAGSHVITFRFTRAGAPDITETWMFVKSMDTSLVRLITPNGGEVLKRQIPFTITWTMPSSASVSGVVLSYSTDGGKTFPHTIASIMGPATSFTWRPPNIATTQARVKVTVIYETGAQASDTSDGDFTIQKGYSFMAWRPDFGGYYTSFRAWLKPPYSFRAGW
ncbi:right-handed parallel beta-helix repeat-containing protein [Methanothrix sp.]|uniref:right-handed parallel beta-helix repeat-containing protein n=1 Tax=Methanothrix sp. TaxID=90426 RepID=UPI0034E1CBAA